jgi:hypothetical protein
MPAYSEDIPQDERRIKMATNSALTKLLKGRTVDSVRQRETELDIDLADGSTLSIKLAAATKSITLTSKDDKTEYAE